MPTSFPWPPSHFVKSRGVMSPANFAPSFPLISTCRSTLTSHKVTWLTRCQYSSNGSVVSEVPVLRGDPTRGREGVRHLQSHVPPWALHGPVRGILASRQPRDLVGCQRRTGPRRAPG